MVKTFIALAALALPVVACGQAPAPEPEALLADATMAMGASDLSTIEYTGSGWDSTVGHAWSVAESWARWELTDYDRVIDYEAVTSRQTAQRRAGLDQNKLGGQGAQPNAAPSTQTSTITANSGWTQQLPVWLTPYGFLRLAEGKSSTVEAEAVGGTRYNVLSFPVEQGDETYRMRGYFDGESVLRKIQTWLDDPVLGDMLVEVEFSDYEDIDGLLFPTHMLESRGGLGFKEITVDSVIPNATIEEPAQAAAGGGRGGAPGGRGAGGGRGAAPGGGGRGAGGGRGVGAGGGGRGAPADAAAQELAMPIGDGIWVIGGGYQSTVVEFDDFVAVIEGAQNAGRSQIIIAEAKRLTGDKPIRYYVTTHTHFDHISGIRDFVAEGSTIIAHNIDVPFYEMALGTPHTMNPDLAEELGATPVIQGVGETFVLEDDTQRIELYKINGHPHADDMMIAYLPSIHAIVEADVVQPWVNPTFGGGGDGPHPFLTHLKSELDRLALDYDTIVPVHAPTPPPTMTRADFEAVLSGGD